MLVLSRKVGEKIHIGNDVLVEVRRISGNRVTLALRAPRDVRILRAELEPAANAFEPTSEPVADQPNQTNGPAAKPQASIHPIDSFVERPSTAEFAT